VGAGAGAGHHAVPLPSEGRHADPRPRAENTHSQPQHPTREVSRDVTSHTFLPAATAGSPPGQEEEEEECQEQGFTKGQNTILKLSPVWGKLGDTEGALGDQDPSESSGFLLLLQSHFVGT